MISKYRPDIDGLRAIAVFSVIIFHALPRTLPGGYLGVDIFFVISGFLITGLLLNQIKDGRLKFSEFYSRRIKRLLPAFLLMVFAATAAGLVILTPAELKHASWSGLAATLSVSNFLFASQTGYFSPDIENDPFLHTWSLGVEEQFYLVFPLLLFLLFRATRGKVLAAIAIIFIASFGYAVYSASVNPIQAYFNPLSRAWQLAAGALCAAWLHQNKSPLSIIQSNLVQVIALLLVIVPMVYFTKGHATAAWPVAIPVFGTILLLIADPKTSRVSQLLSISPLVGFGLLSYSLYLWHQPILAYARLLEFDVADPATFATILIGLCIVSFLSWKFVENPIRKSKAPAAKVFPRAFIAIILLGFVFATLSKTGGAPARFSERAQTLADYTDELEIVTKKCTHKIEDPIDDKLHCNFTNGNTQPIKSRDLSEVVFLGDSHSAALLSGFLKLNNGPDVTQISIASCRPTVSVIQTDRPLCLPHMRAAVNEILQSDTAKSIVLHSRWSQISPSLTVRAEETDEILTLREIYSAYAEVVKILKDGGKDVYYVGPVPEMPFNTEAWAGRREHLYGSNRELVGISAEEYDRRHKNHDLVTRADAIEFGATYISPRDSLCFNEENFCYGEKDGYPLYFDDDHLNPLGAEFIARDVLSAIRQNK